MSLVLLAVGIVFCLCSNQSWAGRALSAALFVAAIFALGHLPGWITLPLAVIILTTVMVALFKLRRLAKSTQQSLLEINRLSAMIDEDQKRQDGITRASLDPIGRQGMSPAAARDVAAQQSHWRSEANRAES